jgi:hypothetical protein
MHTWLAAMASACLVSRSALSDAPLSAVVGVSGEACTGARPRRLPPVGWIKAHDRVHNGQQWGTHTNQEMHDEFFQKGALGKGPFQ